MPLIKATTLLAVMNSSMAALHRTIASEALDRMLGQICCSRYCLLIKVKTARVCLVCHSSDRCTYQSASGPPRKLTALRQQHQAVRPWQPTAAPAAGPSQAPPTCLHSMNGHLSKQLRKE